MAGQVCRHTGTLAGLGMYFRFVFAQRGELQFISLGHFGQPSSWLRVQSGWICSLSLIKWILI